MKITYHVLRFISVFVIMLAAAVVSIMAQTSPPRTTKFTLPSAPSTVSLDRFDLEWIKTGNDFDQSKFSTEEEIDKEIANRINAYDRETAIVTYEVPINSKRLTKPNSSKTYKTFDANIGIINKDLPNSMAYFWRYRDIDIAVPGNTYQDQLNVYSVIRALEILRCRYPKAYQKLFIETRAYSSQAPTRLTFINRFKSLLISFNTFTTASIAESGQVLGINETPTAAYGKYPNLGVISIQATNILGNDIYGSSAIYKKNPDENYLRYLREGLVETLVHEMLHRYIDTRAGIDELETIIFKARPPVGGIAKHLNILWEEVFINNTSLSYFNREGGLQPSIPYYYRGVLEGNIAALHGLRLAKVPDDMSLLNNFNGSNYIDIMRLKVLD